MVTEKQKRQAQISLLREGIAQLEEDFKLVKTDHGITAIVGQIHEFEEALTFLEEGEISLKELDEIEANVEREMYPETTIIRLISEIRRLREEQNCKGGYGC